MARSDTSKSDTSVERLQFPEDELQHAWLFHLLKAYAITDSGVAESIRREVKQGRTLACGKGCASCCRSHTTIPVYPVELVGIAWYVTEKTDGEIRSRLATQLLSHQKGEPCPFLLDEACAIHPLRPMACRQFNVFGERCQEGEDAYYTRRQDVLNPLREFIDNAYLAMMPFYGVTGRKEQKQALKTGEINKSVQVLQELDWPNLSKKIAAYDAANHQTASSGEI